MWGGGGGFGVQGPSGPVAGQGYAAFNFLHLGCGGTPKSRCSIPAAPALAISSWSQAWQV